MGGSRNLFPVRCLFLVSYYGNLINFNFPGGEGAPSLPSTSAHGWLEKSVMSSTEELGFQSDRARS